MKDKGNTVTTDNKRNLYKLLFENHPNPLLVFQRDSLDILSFNNAAKEFYGYSSEEFLKLTILDIRPEEEKQKFIKYFESQDFNNTRAGIWKHKRKDGTVIWVDVTASDIEFNNIPARMLSIIDVTEKVESQQALKDEEMKYQTLVETVNEGIVLADNNDVIKFVNKHYCEMLGYTKEELIGKVGYEVLLDKETQEIIKKQNFERTKGKSNKYELKMRKKDGTPIYMEISGTPVYDKKGDVIGSLGLHFNITDRKKALKALEESEEKFRSLAEHSIVGVYLIQNEIFKYINPRLAEIFGYNINDLLYKKGPKDLTPPEDWKIVKENLRKRVNGEVSAINYSFKGIKKDGSVIYVEVFGSKVTYLDKPAVIGTLLDISARKKAEDSLREKEENFRNLINSSIDSVYVIQDNKLVLVNPAWEKLFGISSKEAISSKFNIMDIVAEESKSLIQERMRQTEQENFSPTRYDMKVITRKQGIRELEVSVSEIMWLGRAAVLGIYRDITDRKEAERILRTSEEKFRDLFELAPVGIYQSTFDGKIITANLRLAKILGFDSTEEFMEHKLGEFYADKNQRQRLITEYESKGSTADIELEWIKKDGSIVWVQLDAHVIQTSEKDKPYFEGFVRDISDRKKAEKEIQETEIRYRQLIESVNAIFWRADANNFQFKFVSKQAETLLGYPIENWLSEPDFWIKHIYPDDVEIAINYYKKATKEKKLYEFDYRMISKDDSLIWLRNIVSVILKDDVPYELIGVMVDMTQQKKSEEEIISAKEKAEEANRLKTAFLSTVSHEIRSPLNAILGFSSILKEIYYDRASEEDKQFFNSMEEAGARLLDTITQVLDISRLEADDFSLNIKPVSFNKCIRSAYNVLNVQAEEKKLKIELDLPGKEIMLDTDEYCLGGVLVNLISNAIKYSKKGTIAVKLRENKDSVICSVRDEGIGMSEEYQKHLFETFSQEDVGLSRRYEGTGLGLAITKRYLDLLGGNIEVQSKKGIGTTMIFSVPKSILIH